MVYRFPGMDPYLEHPGLPRGFHTSLIVVIQEFLMPLLPECYWVDVEETIYVEFELGGRRGIEADVAVSSTTGARSQHAAAAVLAPGFVSLEEVVEIPVQGFAMRRACPMHTPHRQS